MFSTFWANFTAWFKRTPQTEVLAEDSRKDLEKISFLNEVNIEDLTSLKTVPDQVNVVLPTSAIISKDGLQLLAEHNEEEISQDDLDDLTKEVALLIQVPVTQKEFDSLVSFASDFGIDNLIMSRLLRQVNLNNFNEAAKEFDRWVFKGGEKQAALITRRAAEVKIFKNG